MTAQRGAPRVVGLGLCVVDELWRVDDLDLTRERIRYREHDTQVGGMTAAALAWAAHRGCRATLLSLVGDDPAGRFAARELRALGVSTRGLVRHPELPTTRAVVLIHRRSGERRFLLPDRRPVERRAPRFDLSPIRRGAVLLVDGHFAANASRAVRRAREVGVPVVGDFADARPAFRRLLPFVDHPVVPLEFVGAWGRGGPRETLRALAAICPGTPVVTRGPRGALALHDGRFLEVPARRARVVDTTGAGDAFHGAFAAGLALGEPVPTALRRASALAARACSALGGSGWLRARR